MSIQNEILNAIASRRSCRAYEPEQITAEELEAAIENSDDPDTLERVAREKGYGLSRHSDSRQARWMHR